MTKSLLLASAPRHYYCRLLAGWVMRYAYKQ